ncbi:MAG: hypothetical protein AAGE37_00015 [Pseudomonadota bacterium]
MLEPYFVVLAPKEDIHAQAVVREAHLLGSNSSCIIDFSDHENLEFLWSSREKLILETPNGDQDLLRAQSIWWRRFATPNISKFDLQTNEYCSSEYRSALQSIFRALETDGRIKNCLTARQLGNSKVSQLETAQKHGLNIPETIITNSPEKALDFAESNDWNIVAKGFGGTKERYSPTQQITLEDELRLQSLVSSPIILQKRVRRGRDYRVTVVNNQIFSAAIETDFPGAKIDWRLDAAATCVDIDLGERVNSTILKITKELGLFFCTIDLIEDPEGSLFFLEVNESGQFLFVEIDTGMKISEAVARGLLGLG